LVKGWGVQLVGDQGLDELEFWVLNKVARIAETYYGPDGENGRVYTLCWFLDIGGKQRQF
jgi:hypothetical protein